MKEIMNTQIRSCIVMFSTLTLLTGVVYPAFVTVVAQVLFPHQANGSVIEQGGSRKGSELIGQTFDAPHFFWGRPSATSPTGYNSAASTGSNLGPTNPALLEAIKVRIAALREAHPGQTQAIPADLVTASGSGLDPHISPAAAEFQVGRVAKARGMSVEKLREIVARHTRGRQLGLLGEPCVNVLELNLELGTP